MALCRNGFSPGSADTSDQNIYLDLISDRALLVDFASCSPQVIDFIPSRTAVGSTSANIM